MGIVQSDIIIREAIRAGIREMRDNPDLIEDMLAELTEDTLTSGKYGDLTIQQCKDWFTKTKINVKLSLQVSQADLPAVAIALGAGPEGESVIGDVDWDGPDVDPKDATKRRSRRSVMAGENYTLACFVHGEPEYALFLYSVVLFTILRVKERLLDQRGFEVSTFAVGALARGPGPEMESVYVRNITLSGKVRHTWPAESGKVATSVDTNLPTDSVVEPPGQTVKVIRSSVATDLALLLDQDMLQGVR